MQNNKRWQWLAAGSGFLLCKLGRALLAELDVAVEELAQ